MYEKTTKSMTKKARAVAAPRKKHKLFSGQGVIFESATIKDDLICLNLKLTRHELTQVIYGKNLKRVFTRKNAERLHDWLTKALTAKKVTSED
jgi:hypothetical protein